MINGVWLLDNSYRITDSETGQTVTVPVMATEEEYNDRAMRSSA